MTAAPRWESRILLQPGELWPAARRTGRTALRSGALQPWRTRLEVIEEQGVRFQVRVLESRSGGSAAQRIEPRAPVAAERSPTAEAAAEGKQGNPFLPYEVELFVADVSDSHLALLNKFPVTDLHLLLVTREFEEQESRLTRRDWETLWLSLEQGEALGFYNSGTVAGASQRHRHLQLVPLPLVAGEPSVPIEALLPDERADPLAEAPGLPFRNLFARLDASAALQERVQVCEDLYADALRRQGDLDRPAPYNLLVTRQWFLFVPRTGGEWQQIPVNALGFAGALLVRDERGLERLRRAGPAALLSEVAARPGSRPLATSV